MRVGPVYPPAADEPRVKPFGSLLKVSCVTCYTVFLPYHANLFLR